MKSIESNNRLVDNSLYDRIFDFVNYLMMFTILFVTIYPFLNILALSFSGVSKIGLSILPKDFTVINYKNVATNPMIWIGYKNTIIRVLVGTSITLIVTILTAYPLSKKDMPFRTAVTLFIVFTMFFDGGMIPSYILIKKLKMFDTIWALVLPRLVDTFALIVMRNYFMTLPESIEEAAKVDGAGYFKTLVLIILPISGPIIATIVLWTAVWHWNSWFDALLYAQKYKNTVLQMVLRRIVIEGTAESISVATESAETIANPDIIKAATIIFSTAPILIIYPFLQKYFVKGVVVGAVKG